MSGLPDLPDPAARARNVIVEEMVAFVREAERQGWDPTSFVPGVAWRVLRAIGAAKVVMRAEQGRGGTQDMVGGTQKGKSRAS